MRAQSGRRRSSRFLQFIPQHSEVGWLLQSVAMHCGLARIPGGAAQGQTIEELSEHGSMMAGRWPSALHSPEQNIHVPLLSFTWQGQGPSPGGQGQSSQEALSLVTQGREQKLPLTPCKTVGMPLKSGQIGWPWLGPGAAQ